MLVLSAGPGRKKRARPGSWSSRPGVNQGTVSPVPIPRIHEYGSTVRAVQAFPVTGVIAQVMMGAALAGTVGLRGAGWVVGVTCGLILNAALARGILRYRPHRLGQADWVTLARATLTVGVAALIADSFGGPAHVTMLVTLSAVALALDAVDGWVARRSKTASKLGARFDGEVDAFLILVLSVYVARATGAWVLAIGAARYAFLAAGGLLPWMREPLPPRYWRKVVAATQGVVLTIAAAEVLPPALTQAALVGALALLCESFGRDVWWLWRHRPSAHSRVAAVANRDLAAQAGRRRGRVRTSLAAVLTILAILLVWGALVAPDHPSRVTPSTFSRLPLEGIVVIALALALPATARRILAWVVGPALGLLVILKLLDIGFFATFDRPFDPVADWSYAGIGIETLRDSVGRTDANLAVAGAAVLVVAVLLLTTLAVLRLTPVVFVESYGKVAIEGSSFSSRVNAVLDEGTERLGAAGFHARSAFLNSPTFGGASWLAHSTLHSGVWVDSQRRYDQLVETDRFTLSQAFKRAGWRTVGDVPANSRDWPQGTSFYRYDKVYDQRNLGYLGPRFAWASMPDQYVLSALQRLELAKPDRPPVFAEVDLVSSHAPWTRIPELIDWGDVGNGSVFNTIPVDQVTEAALWSDPERVRAAYGRSIEYSLSTLISFVQHYGDDDLVLVVLGDHQPWLIVTGQSPSHDVPISVIAHDPAVLDQIAGWDWEDGLRPGPQAPVWPMNAFRDRFLSAFGSQPSG